ncbi:MAG: acyl-CoA dehydrogenase family protein, partial [Dehalococcoidia bacterium]
MVDFTDNPDEAAFRAEVRQVIAEHAPKSRREGGRARRGGPYGAGGLSEEARREQERWREALIERRWIVPNWPAEYGGAGLPVKDQFILSQELAEAGTWNISGLGTMMFGPTLIVHGSEQQKQEHLPKI